MAGTSNDINSTEKLLDVIRGKKSDSYKEVKSLSALPDRPVLFRQRSLSFINFFSEKKLYTIGVDIGRDVIRLARTIKTSGGNPVLVDYKIISFDKQINKGSPEFREILRITINSFCGSTDNCSIWALMNAADVNVYNRKIPRVAKKQLENAIYWSAKKENPFDEKDYLFDYEIQGEVIDLGIPKYSVMIYTAPKSEITKVKNLFSDINVDLAGITIAPFAIQNIFRTHWVRASEGTVASLFIGDDYSRIDIYAKESLAMTRDIKTGISSMMESIMDNLFESEKRMKITTDEARKILFSLSPDSEKLAETDAGFGLTEEAIRDMIMPALDRLTRQVERTLDHYVSALGFERVENIYISSPMNIYEPIISYIGEQLGVKSETFDPFQQHASHHAVEKASVSERMSLVPVLGLSFSDNYRTPNAIFTYLHKSREEGIKRLNKGIFAGFALIMIACIIALGYQMMGVEYVSNQKAKLNIELARYNPLVTPDMVTKAADKVKGQQQISQQYIERYMGMALIAEITALTPANIRLINLKVNFGKMDAKTSATDKIIKTGAEVITLDGIVTGERNMLDSFLTQYIMKLGNSPILQQVAIQKSGIINLKKTEALQFTIIAKKGS